MNWRIISLPLIVIGVLVYHLSQKSIPKHVNPIVAFAVACAIAFFICLTILYTSGELKTGIGLIRNRDWLPIIILGLSLIPVELGFLYACRTGLESKHNFNYHGPIYHNFSCFDWHSMV